MYEEGDGTMKPSFFCIIMQKLEHFNGNQHQRSIELKCSCLGIPLVTPVVQKWE